MSRLLHFGRRGFTLFELMLAMTIFSMLMVLALDAVANIGFARTKSMTKITLLEELYYFSEKLTTQIKEGGIVDYEEYWNRQVVGTGTATGHYLLPTGFGNYGSGGVLGGTVYGSGYYYCRSGNGSPKVGTGGCMNANINTASLNQTGIKQRYGQYLLQFTDYNGNADNDAPLGILGDEDQNGNIVGDEDDKDIGDGPTILSGSTPELYLINPLTKERLYFRLTYAQDPNNPANCVNLAGGAGCLGNIEILKLKGLDIGMIHSGSVTDPGAFDGNIDTWICHPDWNCTGPALPNGYGTLPTGTSSEWVSLFPDYVNVKQLSFSVYPLKDPWRSWAAPDFQPGVISPFIHPYVRLQLTLGLAWEKRKLIKGDDPSISVSTTISLTNTTNE